MERYHARSFVTSILSSRSSHHFFHKINHYLFKTFSEFSISKRDLVHTINTHGTDIGNRNSHFWSQLGISNTKIQESSPKRKRKYQKSIPNMEDPYYYHPPFKQKDRSQDVISKVSPIQVVSLHFCQMMNLELILNQSVKKNYESVKYILGTNSLLLQFNNKIIVLDDTDEDSINPFIVLFRYGSIVTFHINASFFTDFVTNIQPYVMNNLPNRTETFHLQLKPEMTQTAHVISGDSAMIQSLTMDSVNVISTVLGQTVALDRYTQTVDDLMSKFAEINETVLQTGSFTQLQRKSLFKLIAQNNALSLDMLQKVGLFDKSDIAWKMLQYERIDSELRQEFEMDVRFQRVRLKLEMIQNKAKFFLEVMQSQKSHTLEWIIVVLITFECVLMVMEMGM